MYQGQMPYMPNMPVNGGMYGGMNFQVPPMQDINVSQAQFQPFSAGAQNLVQPENINLIMDVPLEVTVELGRTSKSIKEILDFSPGTIIELNKLAGEPVDVLVNGKFVAKGEVVVIEESFGIRVTEIVK
jgi:flagellar motor switch protein FliN/FliY